MATIASKNTTNVKHSAKLTTRLLKDVRNIMKNPLTNNGIYYVHSESNMYKGYAMIIGPEDTPYEDGFYFFDFTFPKDYPFSPPQLVYCTNDGDTRFNPNLYRNGKVCLSILNTWRGEQWTACQTIRSVLMTLVTLLNNNPLINEPGFSEKHLLCKPYRIIIEYKNFKTAIYGMLTQRYLTEKFLGFYPIIKEHIKKRKDVIYKRLDTLAKSKLNGTVVMCRTYNMKTKLNYEELRDKISVTFADF